MKTVNLPEKEILSSEISSLDIMTRETASNMFPDVELANSENVVYFPFRLCSSLPTVNARGRCFTPRVLQNSFDSIKDQLVNLEHQLIDNEISNKDTIVGHVKAVKISGKSFDVAELANKSNISPVPVDGLGCLYLRAKAVERIVGDKSNINGKKWKVSMECGHKWTDLAFYYENEFIDIKDAPNDMIDCIEFASVKNYKGKKLSIALGGIDKSVDFWGLALTQMPADDTTDVFGFVSGKSRDLSSKKIFYMPIHAIESKASELASIDSVVEDKIKEISNIEVIGETEESNGHKHMILSNMTILPSNGHGHFFESMNVSIGTKPKLTGLSENHYDFIRNDSGDILSEVQHRHLVDIDLKKKVRSSGDNGNNLETANRYNDVDIQIIGGSEQKLNLNTQVKFGEKTMKLKDLLAKFSETASAFSMSDDDDSKKSLVKELGSLASELKKSFEGEEISSRIKEEIEKKIQAKELFTSEQVEEAVTEAKSEIEKEHEEKEKKLEVKNSRIQKCIESEIDLDYEFEGTKDKEGNSVTVRSYIDRIGFDEDSDQDFLINFELWKNLPKKEKSEGNNNNSSSEENKSKEAASASRNNSLALAGGGPSSNGSDESNVSKWFSKA